MKKLFLLLLGATLTLTSCSKEGMDNDPAPVQQQQDYHISGGWAVQLDANLADTFGFEYYAFNFGNGISVGNSVSAYYFNYSDTCATFEGTWTVTEIGSDYAILQGSGTNTIRVSYLEGPAAAVNAVVSGISISGTIIPFTFNAC